MQLIRPEIDLAFLTHDPKAAKTFYRDIIGLETIPSLPVGEVIEWRYGIGNHWFKLFENPKLPSKARTKQRRDTPGALNKFSIVLDKLEARVERLRAAGYECDMRVSADGFERMAVTRDVDDNVLQLIEAGAGSAAQRSRLQMELTVADLERSRVFYHDVLGFADRDGQAPSGDDDSWAFLAGCTSVNCVRVQPPEGTKPAKKGFLHVLTLMVDDMDGLHAQFVEAGVKLVFPPTPVAKIVKLMVVQDPDGHSLEFCEPLTDDTRARMLDANSARNRTAAS